VAEYDAFGRRNDEQQRAGVSTPVGPTPPPRRRRSGPGPAALVALVTVFVVAAAGGILLATRSSTTHGRAIATPVQAPREASTPAAPTSSTPQPEPAAPPAPPAPPAGLSRASLIRRENLSPALDRMRRGGLGRLVSLRVAAERVDAQLVTRDGRLRNIQITSAGELLKLSLSGRGFGFVQSMAFGDVDPSAPQRLVRAVAQRRGVSPRKVDYLVVSRFGTSITWNLFLRSGARFQGDASGRL
jgi:hypothetical protein